MSKINIYQGPERRRYPRVKEIGYVVYKSPVTGKSMEGLCNDLSIKGMRIEGKEKLPLSSKTIIQMDLPMVSTEQFIFSLSVAANVVWCKRTEVKPDDRQQIYLTGLEFRAVSQETKKQLTVYLQELKDAEKYSSYK